MQIEIKTAKLRDYEVIRAINEMSVPHVSTITADELRTLAPQCFYFAVVWADGECAGFLMAMRPGEEYDSPHYQWFSQHYEDFVYVDRIAVAPSYKGFGIGRALYADVERAAKSSTSNLTCEVNLAPPNPDSMAFHARLGFAEVGQLESEGGKKRVSLMVKVLRGEQIRPQGLKPASLDRTTRR